MIVKKIPPSQQAKPEGKEGKCKTIQQKKKLCL